MILSTPRGVLLVDVLRRGDDRREDREHRLGVQHAGQTGAYIATGLVLFLITFAVNAAARAIIARRKDFTE